VKIKRVDKELPLPKYETDLAAGFDVYVRGAGKEYVDKEDANDSVILKPNETAYLFLNVIIETPEGYKADLQSRSSTFRKKGVILTNSIGLIDQDFSGEGDEIAAHVINLTNKAQKIEKGDRLFQLVITPYTQVEFEEVDDMGEQTRGGFGSTDNEGDD